MLELKGLTRRYGDLVALDDLSFAVREGQMFGFVGPNGAGKTTAMRIILGVLAPDAGEVRWRGQPMTDEIRKQLGYLPEDHGQTFSTQCARTSRGSSGPILGRLGQQANHRNEQVRLAATTQFRYLPPLSERHEAGRRDACRSRWRVTLTAPVRCESRRMWLAASNTNLTPLVTGPVIQLSQRHARSVAADELGLLVY
jgi:ABC-type branched-subunit amino acid transport system ATPase component